MVKILGLSGKKGSGKNTSANFVFGHELVSLGIISWMRINDKGELVVPTTINDKVEDGILDPFGRNSASIDFFAEHVWPFVKLYSYADQLKKMCCNILGLTGEQCWGTNEQKDSPTQYFWHNAYSLLTPTLAKKIGKPANEKMTAREVMQFLGTNVFRKFYDDVWVESTINSIIRENSQLAIITDVRFPNEVLGIQKAGGRCIRLTRQPFTEDQHESEMALDRFDTFDAIIDNGAMSIEQQNHAVYDLLKQWNYIE